MNIQFNTFIQLILHDLILFKRKFFGKLFDTCIELFFTVFIFAFIMPKFGLVGNYASFILVGAISSFGFFELIGKVSELVSEIEGNNVISYYVTLPIKSSLVFCAISISWAIQSAVLSLFLFPLGKLLLWNQFNFDSTSIIRLVLIFILINLFFGAFALWLASVIKRIRNVGQLWVRILSPMYMFGCYFYTWFTMFGISKYLAIISLINPLIFVFEGMRSAILGSTGYIPFVISFFSLILFTSFCLMHGIYKMKKRMDCI